MVIKKEKKMTQKNQKTRLIVCLVQAILVMTCYTNTSLSNLWYKASIWLNGGAVLSSVHDFFFGSFIAINNE